MNNNFFKRLYKSQKVQAILTLFVMSVITFNPFLQFSFAGNYAVASNDQQQEESTNSLRTDYCEIEISKEFKGDDSAVKPGDEITYRLTLKNVGTGRCIGTGVKLEDLYPDNQLEYMSYTLGAEYYVGDRYANEENFKDFEQSIDSEGGRLTWNFGAVEPAFDKEGREKDPWGGVRTVDVTFKVKDSVQCEETIVNKLRSYSSSKDKYGNKLKWSDYIENTIQLAQCNTPAPEYCELLIKKSDFGYDPVKVGDDIVYTLYLANIGTGECKGGGVKLQDLYPDNQLEYVSYELGDDYPYEGDQFTHEGNELTWNFGTVKPATTDPWGGVREVKVTFNTKDSVQCEETIVNKLRSYTSSKDKDGNKIYWSDYISEDTTVEECAPTPAYCGDGIVQTPNDYGVNEQCDDGNNDDGDGCSAQCTIEVPNDCQLKLSKVVDKSTAELGDAINYTLVLENTGTDECTGVVLAEDYPDGVSFVSSTPLADVNNNVWNVGTLDASEKFEVAIEAEVQQDTNLCSTTQVNKATYTSNETGVGEPVEASTDIQCIPSGDCILQLEKTDSQDPVRPGDDLVYTLKLTNTGDASCTNVVLEEEYDDNTTYVSADKDPLDSSGTKWMVGSMVPGDVFEVAITTKVDSEADNADICTVGSLLNTAYRSSSQTARGSVTEPTAIECVTDPVYDVYLTKTVNDDSVQKGENVNFTITVGNEGDTTMTDVVVKDYLPTELTYVSNLTSTGTLDINLMEWTVGDLEPNQKETLDLTVTVSQDGTFTNKAEVIAHNEQDRDSVPNNGVDNNEDDWDSATVTASSGGGCTSGCGGGGGPVSPYISIVKSASVQFTNPDTVVAYTISVTNTGNATGNDLVVTDTLPSPLTYVSSTIVGTWNLGDILVGETKTLTYEVQFPENITAGNYKNIATASISNGNTVEDDAVVEVRVPNVLGETFDPALSIEKSVDRTFTNPGGEAVYTVIVTNVTTNNVTAKNVILTDRMPEVFTFVDNNASVKGWKLGDLAPGESKTVTYTINVADGTASGTYDNIARASSDNTPEVYAIEPLEVRNLDVLGYELPDTNGVETLYLTMLSGLLMIALGWMVWKYRQLSINEL